MKKKIAIILTVIMMLAIFSGCGSKGSGSSNKKVKILFSLSDGSDNFRKLLAQYAESYAKSQNVELTVMDAAGSIEKQVSHMKEAVTSGYSAIVCAPVNIDTALQLEKTAEGIPIVFLNSNPKDSLLEKNKYVYVGSDEKVAGQYQAEYIASYLKSKNDVKVVLLKGEKGHPATKGRTEAAKQTLKEKGINVEYVFEDNANWSRQTAKDMFNVFLSTGKKFDCVIANNDEMALGVVDSLRENNMDPSSIPILGVDATSVAKQAVVDGSMKLTVFQPAEEQSKSAVQAAIELGSGGSLSNIKNVADNGKYIWVPFEKVDSSNVNKYMN